MYLDGFLFLEIQFLAVPLYFIVYSTIRYIYHWHDGKEPTISSYSRIHFFKRVLTLIMMVITIYLAIQPKQQEGDSSNAIIRKSCYLVYCIAWGLSHALIIFEDRRRLKIQWWGHRLFWFMSSVNNLTKMIVHLTWLRMNKESSTEELVISNIIDIISTITCCSLMLLGLVNPEIRIKITREGMLNEIRIIHYDNLQPNIENGPESLPFLKTQIQDVKMKQVNGKNILFYNILLITKFTCKGKK